MNFVQHLLRLYKAHRFAFWACIALALVLMALAIQQQAMAKTASFLATMSTCFLLTEFMCFTGGLKFKALSVKQPKVELMIVVLVQVLVIGLLVFWFLIVGQEVGTGVKIVIGILRLLLAYPIFYLIYFLAIKRYKLKALGFTRFSHWYMALPVIVLIGGVSYLFFPEGLQFEGMLEESGYLSFVTLGFLTAAIPEEITRTLLHTRLNAVFQHQGVAWFFTSLFWALTHIPSFMANSGDAYGAFIGALGILPIGLLWGYLNHRFKSIIPSVLIHGTNLWGLQNIF